MKSISMLDVVMFLLVFFPLGVLIWAGVIALIRYLWKESR